MPFQRSVFFVLFLCWTIAMAHAQTSPRLIDDVPIPQSITVSKNTEKTGGEFIGAWVGTWGNDFKHILIVKDVKEDGSVDAVYAVGQTPRRNNKGRYFAIKGSVQGNVLTIQRDKFIATYTLGKTGRLSGIFGNNSGTSVLVKHDISELLSKTPSVRWSVGKNELVEVDLAEDGQSIKLETVVFKPEGDGPFRLAIVNHGSTGTGTDPASFTQTWTHEWFAEYLNNRGWIAAFPQRRGRGKSNGLYDEGFGKNRSQGYSCNTAQSLAGAERALEDLNAIVQKLITRPDVQKSPILMSGTSRGGILSVAYAGQHAKQVKGVVNFVGGWMSDHCKNAVEINQSLFSKGAAFPAPMKWIYGEDDPYYSSQHNQSNFKAFQNEGGTGSFEEVQVNGTGNGHWAMFIPALWETSLTEYLNELDSNVK